MTHATHHPSQVRPRRREPARDAVVGWLVKRVIETLVLAMGLAAVPLAHGQSRVAADAGIDAPAQPAVDPFRQLVDSDPFAGDDPVGEAGQETHVDPLAAEGTGDLRTAALPTEDTLVSERLPITRGEVLSAVAGVREIEHVTRIELVAGLALVRTEMRFESSARYAAEISYRIAAPPGAVPFAIEVCRADGTCRAGVLEDSAARLSAYDAALVATGPIAQDSRPIAVFERIADALVVRAAPVPAAGVGGDGAATRGELVVRVGYAVQVPVSGGVARLTLPARGSDVRASVERLSLSAVDLVVPELDGVEVSPNDTTERQPPQGAEIVAHVPRTWSPRVEAWSAPCAREQCVWARASSVRPEVPRADVILAIDASPSTTSGARGLIPEAAMSLLSSLPSGSRARVVAFAARAEVVLDAWTDVTDVEETTLRRATDLELGSATRFDALWELLGPSAQRGTTIVWIGDGGITSSDEGTRALEEAARRGVSLRIVSVADRASAPGLVEVARRFDVPIVGTYADAMLAARNRREALDARMASVLARDPMTNVALRGLGEPRTLALVAGGAEVVSTHVRTRPTITVSGAGLAGGVAVQAASGDLALAVAALGRNATRVVAAEAGREASVCTADQTVLHGSTSAPRVTALPNRFAVVERRTCRAPASATTQTSTRRSQLSRVALLRTLRQRIIPRARDCFRSDRRGRAEYSTQVQLILTLADQEIVDVRAEGAIEPALRTCMVRAADGLEVPPFEGVILARWPLYSRPELGPPTLELHPDLATAIDAIGHEATPAPTE